MMHHRYAKLIAIFLLTLPGSGFATSFPEEENWHQIEVIIFAQEDSFGIERSPLSPKLGYPDNLKLLNPPEPLYTAVPEDASIDEKLAALMVPNRFLNREQAALATAFAPLDAAQRQLNPDAQALKRQSSYRVLFHEAWQQPVPTRRHAPWIFIRGGDSYGKHTELEGSIRFHHSRFYHMETHLWLSRFKPAESTETSATAQTQPPGTTNGASAPSESLQAPSANAGILLPELPVLFTEQGKSPQLRLLESLTLQSLPQESPLDDEPVNLSDLTGTAVEGLPQSPAFLAAAVDVLKDSDQIKRKTLNYIDHPRMGVLVLITPMSTEAASDEEEDFPEQNFPEERLED